MVQGKWFPAGAELSVPLSIREAVFGSGRDAADDWAQQVVVYDDADRPVGTARLFWRDGAFWVELLGVLAGERGKRFGDLLIRLCLFKALTHEAREVRLIPTAETAAFFGKYGFTPAEGGEMSIRAEDIQLDTCSRHCKGCPSAAK